MLYAASCKIHILTDNLIHGYQHNFEHALKYSSGDIIFLADQDDIWLTNKVAKIVDVYLQQENALFVFHNASCIDASGNALSQTLSPFVDALSAGVDTDTAIHLEKVDYLERAASGTFVVGMVTSLSRALLEIVLPFPIPLTGHDHWLPFCALSQNGCYFYNAVLTYRRLHESNVTEARKQPFFSRIGRIKKRIIKFQSVGLSRYNTALAMKSFLEKQCVPRDSIVENTYNTLNRQVEIGSRELNAEKSGKLYGAIQIISLFLHDKRYRKSGTYIFLYELAYILLFSKKQRLKMIGDI